MTPDERTMIEGLFARIANNQEPASKKDAEANALIVDSAHKDPGALYTLVQISLVQERALKLADARIRELESNMGNAGANVPTKRSFMDGLLPTSPWSKRTSVPSISESVPMDHPGAFPAATPQSTSAPPAAGSFLRSAFGTAVGIAGGMMLFEAVRGLMTNNGGVFSPSAPDVMPSSVSALSAQSLSKLNSPDIVPAGYSVDDDRDGNNDYSVDDGEFGDSGDTLDV